MHLRSWTRHTLTTLTAAFSLFAPSVTEGSCKGKLDGGFAYAHADITSSGQKIRNLDMLGASFNGTFLPFVDACCWTNLFDPIALKGAFSYLEGHGSELWSASIGLGYCIPLMDGNIIVTPQGGITFGELDCRIDIPLLMLTQVSQSFQSRTPYVGIDVAWMINECFMLTGLYQRAWARTKTTTGYISPTISASSGNNFGLQVDYFITKCISAHIAGVRNLARSKEKDGIDIWGARVGVGYYF